MSLVLLALGMAPAFPAIAQEEQDTPVVGLDIGLSYDDNIRRSKDGETRYADSALNVNLRSRLFYPIDENARWVVTWFAGADAFRENAKLSRAFGGVKAERQYRPSADFDAPTIALFGQVSGDYYGSLLRRGYRAAVGTSMLLPITDRIVAFGALAYSVRDAESAVFDATETSLRVNLDYALTASSTLYLGAEYRVGDIVSSGPASLANLDIAKWVVRDDAFTDGQVFAYRFEGQIAIATVGYNIALGTHNALDFAFRLAVARPDEMPGYPGAVRARYEVKQFHATYLRNF